MGFNCGDVMIIDKRRQKTAFCRMRLFYCQSVISTNVHDELWKQVLMSAAFCYHALRGLASMPPKRLRQATLTGLRGSSDAQRPHKHARKAGSACRGIWVDGLPTGLMVYRSGGWQTSAHLDGTGDASAMASDNEVPVTAVAAFDLDNTLIKTKSGAKFPRSPNDWTWAKPMVQSKLKQLLEDRFTVVIFTNQAGVSNGRIDENFVRVRVEQIVSDSGVPMACYVATAKDHFRKPSIEMWDCFLQHIGGAKRVDCVKSFYVGDAAGRPGGRGRPRDFSDTDRKYAINIGVRFYTPEMFFEGHTESVGSIPLTGYDPRSADVVETLIEDRVGEVAMLRKILTPVELTDLVVARNSDTLPPMLIMLCGLPASGKSTFAHRYLIPRGFQWVNQDTMKTASRCKNATKVLLSEGKSVVIDMTNPRKITRATYTEIARSLSRDIVIAVVKMNTSREVAEHLNIVRERMYANEKEADKHERVPAVAFNTFAKFFEEPTLDEGVDYIGSVEFLPHFANDRSKALFLQLS